MSCMHRTYIALLQRANAARSELPENGMRVTVSSSTRSSPDHRIKNSASQLVGVLLTALLNVL